jgi:trans-aconitate methyltransferase
MTMDDTRRPATRPGPGEWLDRAGITQRLAGLEQPRVADLGCGTGRSTILLAERLPGAGIVGVDIELSCVEEARANVARARRSAQIAIRRCDAADLGSGPYDLVTIFGMLRRCADPVGVLVAANAQLAADGEVLLAVDLAADVSGLAAAARFDHVEELAVTPGIFRVCLLR